MTLTEMSQQIEEQGLLGQKLIEKKPYQYILRSEMERREMAYQEELTSLRARLAARSVEGGNVGRVMETTRKRPRMTLMAYTMQVGTCKHDPSDH